MAIKGELMLEDLIRSCEEYVKPGEPTNIYRSVTGEPYIVLTSGGIKMEGAPFGRFYETEQDAIEAFKAQFSFYCSYKNCYLNNKDKFKLYWRWKPELKENNGFMVMARLLISDKSALEVASA